MELTVPYTPEQNGVAERMNRTIIEQAKTMFIDSGLPHRLWPEVYRIGSGQKWFRQQHTYGTGRRPRAITRLSKSYGPVLNRILPT